MRELREELGITVRIEDCEPIAFADDGLSGGQLSIVIMLYRIEHFEGIPLALEGGAVGWFNSQEIARLDKPPLDIALARQLRDAD